MAVDSVQQMCGMERKQVVFPPKGVFTSLSKGNDVFVPLNKTCSNSQCLHCLFLHKVLISHSVEIVLVSLVLHLFFLLVFRR